MNNKIITINNVKIEVDDIKNVKFINYTHFNDYFMLANIITKEDELIWCENYYGLSFDIKTQIENKMEKSYNELKDVLIEKNIFVSEYSLNGEKYIGRHIIFRKNGDEIETKIIGYYKKINMFKLENFKYLVSPEYLYLNGKCLLVKMLLDEN